MTIIHAMRSFRSRSARAIEPSLVPHLILAPWAIGAAIAWALLP